MLIKRSSSRRGARGLLHGATEALKRETRPRLVDEDTFVFGVPASRSIEGTRKLKVH